MAQYNQSTGEMHDDNGQSLGRGYSGRPLYRNNPAHEGRTGEGPIPRGSYRMAVDPTVTGRGPLVIRLEPMPGTNTLNRGGFLIHGDNNRNDASEGCIILDRQTRERLINGINGGSNLLQVR